MLLQQRVGERGSVEGIGVEWGGESRAKDVTWDENKKLFNFLQLTLSICHHLT